jgi:hypothetical protein
MPFTQHTPLQLDSMPSHDSLQREACKLPFADKHQVCKHSSKQSLLARRWKMMHFEHRVNTASNPHHKLKARLAMYSQTFSDTLAMRISR